jgi:hypothetical protein
MFFPLSAFTQYIYDTSLPQDISAPHCLHLHNNSYLYAATPLLTSPRGLAILDDIGNILAVVHELSCHSLRSFGGCTETRSKGTELLAETNHLTHALGIRESEKGEEGD